MILTLLNVYIDIDKLGDDLDITLKPKAKFDIINILINLLNGYDSYKFFFKNMNTNTNLLTIKVINIIINDISNNADDIFYLAKSVFKIHNGTKSGMLGYLDSISNLMKFVLNSFNFLLILQNISINIFESEIIFQKLIETFNYYLYWSNGFDPDKKDSKNLSKIFYLPESIISFNIDAFINCIIHFYIGFINNNYFYKFMNEDKRSFRLEFLKKGIKIYTNSLIKCNKKRLLEFHTPYHSSFCEKILTKLEEKPIEIIEKEPPENFIDPITYTLINDPVILPSSKMIVDRTVIVKHLINCSNDPFTRDALTIEKLNDFNLQSDINEKTEKLKREIINWKK